MIELVIRREGEAERKLKLADGAFGIGRQEGNEIRLDDKEVSRKHARLLVDGDLVLPESEVICEYLEEVYPTPSLLGDTPRSRATVRTVSRIGDIYLMNNIFMCLPQQMRQTRNDAIRDLLTGQVSRGLKALEHYIGEGPYAVGDHLTLADCSLVPALFLLENVYEAFDVGQPLDDCPKTRAYSAAIKSDPHAAATLVELHRGLEERRELMKRMMAKQG